MSLLFLEPDSRRRKSNLPRYICFLKDWEQVNFVFDHVYKELIQEIDEIDNSGGSGHSKTDITSRVAKLRKMASGF